MNNPQQFQFTSSQVPSQYRGKQRSFQPTGIVQSMYGQNQSFQQSQSYQQNQPFQQSQPFKSQYPSQSTQSFHMANYKGQQPNHDQAFRSDSQTPTQSQYQTQGQIQNQIQNQNQNQFQFSNRSFDTQQYGTQQYGSQFGSQTFQPIQSTSFSQQQTQYQPSQSYHQPHYAGNQVNHDQYLRSDSNSPSQSSFNTSITSGKFV